VSNRAILVACSLDAPADGGLTMSATCAGVTMTSLGIVHANSTTLGYLQVWGLTGVGTGTLAIVVTVTGGTPDDLEGGSLSFSGAARFGTPATGVSSGTTGTATATLNTNTTGSLIAGFTAAGDSITSATSPSTSRFINNNRGGAGDGTGNAAGATSAATGSAVTMAWALNSATFFAEILVEVQPVTPLPPPPVPLYAPGWFPGADRVTTQPDGIPFYPQPAPTDATPAVIIPPTPEASPPPLPLLPPGWFPGSAAVTQDPGGIPFYAEPPPLLPTPAVIFPVPEVAGIADWLPLPPGWFPGASQVTTDPGSIPFYSLPQPQTPPPAPPPVPVVTGLGGSGYNSWFTDQFGSPRLMVIEQAWSLPYNAGRWNSGNWRSDMDAYFTTRARQGYTAWYGVAWGQQHQEPTSLTGGRTWDGVYPLNINGTPGAIATGAETVTLNNTFWQRIDYLFATARAQGIACFLNMGLSYDHSDTGGIWQNATNTQGTAFGAALTARYPQATYPHVFWFFGDDDDGPNDSFYSAQLSGMQGAGDTRALVSIEQFTNTNCHIEFDNKTSFSGSFGVPNATYNWVYSYDAPYFGAEDSYAEGGSFPHIPAVYGDGVYYGDTGAGTTADRAIRNFAWWALASGSRGFPATSGPSDIFAGPPTQFWQWPSDAIARLATDPNGTFTTVTVGKIATYFSGLADWHKLIPDTGNVFITAGRGTRGTCDAPGGAFNFRNSSTYVAGSVTPAGTLAVIYCKAAMSITIDQTKLGPGYTATWVDPLSLATQTATPAATYNSTPLGNNSAGDPDWVLVLQGTPVAAPAAPALTVPLPPGWFPGADRVTTQPDGIPFYAEPQPADQVAPPAAGLTVATASLAGAGSVTAVVTEAPIAAAAGAGAVAAVVTEAAGAAAAGAGSLTAVVTEIAGASLAGAGAIADTPATEAATASLAGAGSITDVVTQAVIASLAGAGAVNATVAGGASTATITGAGTVTAVATQAATATAAGAGVVAATVTQQGAASLTAAGSVSASGAITGTASLAGAGAVTALAATAAPSALAAAGAVSASAGLRSTAALAAAGAITATGTSAASIINATSNPTVTAAHTSTAAVTDPRDGTSRVTAAATSTPAVTDG
jgi:hypothetical protein